jgi:stearoyl-CoA desaturase (delta-9 desaturase)
MLQSTEVAPAGPATEMVPPVGTISMADGAVKQTGTESSKLRLPETVDRHKILWTYLISIVVVHLLSLLAFVPYFFSWTGVVLAIAGLYVFGTLGINLCYHRLLTHRSFSCPLWLEHALTWIGIFCLQDSPARWVAIHRVHHQNSDEQPDPHSPLVAFLWGHVGWLLVENRDLAGWQGYDRYARDVLKDPFHFSFDRGMKWAWANFIPVVAFYLVGLAIGWLTGGSYAAGVQFGSSLVVWGVFVRLVLVWHITWSVNSLSHYWGYQNYATGENSRNNWFVALVSNGEGWHNNHHADQRSAAHGHRFWEFDVTWLTIVLLEKLGLAWDVIRPNEKLLARREIS